MSGDFQDRGEAVRQRYGIDGTAGDAQDVDHEYADDGETGACLMCGLAKTYRRHRKRRFPVSAYRTGAHWGVTIVREGTGQPGTGGRRPGDELVAVVVNGDRALAARICALLNEPGCDCMVIMPSLMGDHACRCVRGAHEHWQHWCQCGSRFWEYSAGTDTTGPSTPAQEAL